ncbi:MAG: NAD-binding protein, partial [Varibaculum cambriense]|nr:NAD-binding protein [Varibaculum cambriense]
MVKRDAGASGVLVIGLGRFGSAVAASLESLEREVLAVEKSPRIVT